MPNEIEVDNNTPSPGRLTRVRESDRSITMIFSVAIGYFFAALLTNSSYTPLSFVFSGAAGASFAFLFKYMMDTHPRNDAEPSVPHWFTRIYPHSPLSWLLNHRALTGGLMILGSSAALIFAGELFRRTLNSDDNIIRIIENAFGLMIEAFGVANLYNLIILYDIQREHTLAIAPPEDLERNIGNLEIQRQEIQTAPTPSVSQHTDSSTQDSDEANSTVSPSV